LIIPDFENRIKKNEIKAIFNSKVVAISPDSVTIKNNSSKEEQVLGADFVFLMTGYRPDADFLRKIGVNLKGDALIPEINEETFETNIQGIYVAGSIVGGEETAKIFIENGRNHGKKIMADVYKKLNTD